ncbi:hypothetical protein LshimejAT787_0103270 [Lyophyllum shimeji]|uniref:Uncharacterized protein n=1 Tax=Lyophyllum shimeji TaxID=47721 RepID=A0A9P3UHS3_LYOSH|nr:hypothetical protein LshimejAT787_0103270 [Lyophyllum shimeji]
MFRLGACDLLCTQIAWFVGTPCRAQAPSLPLSYPLFLVPSYATGTPSRQYQHGSHRGKVLTGVVAGSGRNLFFRRPHVGISVF